MTDKTQFDLAVEYALSQLGQGGITLRQSQKEAIKAVYEGRDASVWLPTGYGKSLCYQCLPYLLDYKLGKVNSAAVNQRVVMVVSPLVSLMVDQESKLRRNGVQAAILGGGGAG